MLLRTYVGTLARHWLFQEHHEVLSAKERQHRYKQQVANMYNSVIQYCNITPKLMHPRAHLLGQDASKAGYH
jgi:hypothetical protein